MVQRAEIELVSAVTSQKSQGRILAQSQRKMVIFCISSGVATPCGEGMSGIQASVDALHAPECIGDASIEAGCFQRIPPGRAG